MGAYDTLVQVLSYKVLLHCFLLISRCYLHGSDYRQSVLYKKIIMEEGEHKMHRNYNPDLNSNCEPPPWSAPGDEPGDGSGNGPAGEATQG